MSKPATPTLSSSAVPVATSTVGKPMFFGPDSEAWKELKPDVPAGTDPADKQNIIAAAKAAKEELKNFLLSSLQMQHVVVLAGSGTSLGPVTKGPSMWTLWDYCVNANPGTGAVARTVSPAATKVIAEIGYDIAAEKENIEALLSRCEAYLQVKTSTDVTTFITESKKVILEKCSEFIDPADAYQLAAHRTLLHRLSRRRVRDSRLKLFTTNYDLCFETAAGRQGLVVLDGFSFTQPRQFDPRFFLYDIVRRPTTGDEVGTPLEGVFHIYKLHGSVNWSRKSDNEIEVEPKPTPDSACLIYPAKGKYQQSYVQPHLELVSQYFSVLRPVWSPARTWKPAKSLSPIWTTLTKPAQHRGCSLGTRTCWCMKTRWTKAIGCFNTWSISPGRKSRLKSSAKPIEPISMGNGFAGTRLSVKNTA